MEKCAEGETKHVRGGDRFMSVLSTSLVENDEKITLEIS